MNAKELQMLLIKNVIKPTFKKYGYKTKGNNFFKKDKSFYKVLSLENLSWNSKDNVCFWINFSLYYPCVDGEMPEQKLSAHRFFPNIRLDGYINMNESSDTPFRTKTGYQIYSETNYDLYYEYLTLQINRILVEAENTKSLKDFRSFFPNLDAYNYAFNQKIDTLVQVHPNGVY